LIKIIQFALILLKKTLTLKEDLKIEIIEITEIIEIIGIIEDVVEEEEEEEEEEVIILEDKEEIMDNRKKKYMLINKLEKSLKIKKNYKDKFCKTNKVI
jgi:hypothetical protein